MNKLVDLASNCLTSVNDLVDTVDIILTKLKLKGYMQSHYSSS